jgi:cyclic pyranopterin phosphate synthase
MGPQMVDIGDKEITAREAVARGRVDMDFKTLNAIGNATNPKGDVLSVAQLAGIMAAKEASRLIPLAHTLLLDSVKLSLSLNSERSAVEIESMVRTKGKTGAEMEALTAVAVSALTIYDMCKSLDKNMKIQDVRLVSKMGGKSGDVRLED